MIYLIDPDNYHLHRNDLDEMYRLRHRVLIEKLKWSITSQDGMEKDEYDENNMYYLIYKDGNNIIRGAIRFIEMTQPCMFDGPFNFSLPKLAEFKRTGCWELSRLVIDCNYDAYYTQEISQNIGLNLLAGYTYFGLEVENIECTLAIGYPTSVEFYKSNGLIIEELNRVVLNDATREEILVFCFPTLTYCYDRMVSKIGIDPNLPILWHIGPMYKSVEQRYL